MPPLPLPDPELADDAIRLRAQVAQRAGFVVQDAARAPITLKGRTWNLVSYSLGRAPA